MLGIPLDRGLFSLSETTPTRTWELRFQVRMIFEREASDISLAFKISVLAPRITSFGGFISTEIFKFFQPSSLGKIRNPPTVVVFFRAFARSWLLLPQFHLLGLGQATFQLLRPPCRPVISGQNQSAYSFMRIVVLFVSFLYRHTPSLSRWMCLVTVTRPAASMISALFLFLLIK